LLQRFRPAGTREALPGTNAAREIHKQPADSFTLKKSAAKFSGIFAKRTIATQKSF